MPKAKSYDHEVLWPAIRILAEQGSINKLCELLQSGEDIYEVLTLHRFALRFLSFRPWANRNIDVLAAVGSAGIEVAMMAAEEKSDDSAWFREGKPACVQYFIKSGSLLGRWVQSHRSSLQDRA